MEIVIDAKNVQENSKLQQQLQQLWQLLQQLHIIIRI